MPERTLASKIPETKKKNPASYIQKAGHTPSTESPVEHILFLQRTIGNHAVERLIKSGIPQAKSIPGSTPSIKVNDYGMDSVPKNNGQPLNPELKLALERGFGTNLESVRIHNDEQSHEFARSRKAYAVTVGQNIYFGRGKNSSDHKSYFQLMTHEVAHTIQQRSMDSQRQIRNIEQYQSFERQADQAADRIVNGQSANVNPANIGQEEQAKSEGTEVTPNVLAAKRVALLTGVISEDMRRILQTHPPTYDYVMSTLVKRNADWITDKLLELWISDGDEWEIIRTIRKWATTPKIEGGNYLDDLLDAIKKFRYRFSYGVSESAWGNMLDKLFAEMEGDRYTALTSLINNFSVRYKGYRGRGGISRWSGMQTAVMPSEVRARLGRLNQKLAGRTTIPMTQDEVRRINTLYAELRRKTWGMIDMPDNQIGPAVGQQAAPAVAIAIPAIGVAALIEALILAILVTITLVLIIKIIEELERILERTVEAPSETVTMPRAIPKAVPKAIPRAVPRAIPRVVPRVPPILPILWPHFGGKGLPLMAPNPFFSIFPGKILVRSVCPPRNWALIQAFKAAYTVLTGQAVHHVTPLFLGGADALGNLAAVWISYHIAGHTALRYQPHLAALGMPIDLYAHPPGISYIVSGII